MTNWVLIGAGGHAKAIVEGLCARGDRLCAYIDPHRAEWLSDASHVASDEEFDPAMGQIAFGIGGQTPQELERRLALLAHLCRRGGAAPPCVHPSAVISPSANLGDGTVVLAGAIIQPNVRTGRGVIVNTGAIVEHDCILSDGSHIAPGAVLLGACHVGRSAMVGARAVILSGARVPDSFVVTAGTLFRASNSAAA